eukprot:901114-Pyramimonas_sp.AAC.1
MLVAAGQWDTQRPHVHIHVHVESFAGTSCSGLVDSRAVLAGLTSIKIILLKNHRRIPKEYLSKIPASSRVKDVNNLMW